MPIRVQCQCGQSLNVPDNLAGKSGKCPKCGGVIRIPGAGGSSTPQVASKPTAAKPVAAKPVAAKPTGPKVAQAKAAVATPAKQAPAPPAKSAGLGDFFDEAGLTKKTGKFCPNCDTSIPDVGAVCVKCGFNLETGQKLAAHEIKSEFEEFGNAHLNEAARMMAREEATDKRTMNAGVPWWVILNFFLGMVVATGVGIVLVDGRLTSLQPRESLAGIIQRVPVWYTLLGVIGAIAVLTSNFAHFAVVVAAFREKAVHGWLSLFVPFYCFFFGMTIIKKIRGPVLAYIICVVVAVPIIIYMGLNVPVMPPDPSK